MIKIVPVGINVTVLSILKIVWGFCFKKVIILWNFSIVFCTICKGPTNNFIDFIGYSYIDISLKTTRY